MKLFRHILTLTLIVALLTLPAYAWKSEKQDLTETEVTFAPGAGPNAASTWAQAEVEAAIAAGLVPQLTGAPAYTDKITREQFAELAAQLMIVAAPEAIDAVRIQSDIFDDTHNHSVAMAAALGIVTGVGNNKFAPTKTTDREQIATMVARAINVVEETKGVELTPASASIEAFTDKDQVSGWAVEAVGTLAANRIMNGTTATTLSPKNSCTVEQSICLIFRVYQAIQTAD